MPIKLFHFTEAGRAFISLDAVKKLPGTPMKAALYIYEPSCDIPRLFNEWKPHDYSDFLLKQIEINREFSLYQILAPKRGLPKEQINYLMVSKQGPFLILLTNGNNENSRSIFSYVNRYYPFVSRISLRSRELFNLLNDIEKNLNYSVLVKSYIAKRYYQKPKSEIFFESGIPFKQAFQKASVAIGCSIQSRTWW